MYKFYFFKTQWIFSNIFFLLFFYSNNTLASNNNIGYCSSKLELTKPKEKSLFMFGDSCATEDYIIINRDYSWALELANNPNNKIQKILIYKAAIDETINVLLERENRAEIYDEFDGVKRSAANIPELINDPNYKIKSKIADWSRDCGFGCYWAFQDYDCDGYSAIMGDCDDFNASIYPFAVDSTNNDINEDCLGGKLNDDFIKMIGAEDEDGDGYYDLINDCDDFDSLVHNSCDLLTIDCVVNYEIDSINGIVTIRRDTDKVSGAKNKNSRNHHFKAFLFNNKFEAVDSCSYFQSCQDEIIFDSIMPGTYHLYYQMLTLDWKIVVCEDTLDEFQVLDTFTNIICDNNNLTINTIENFDNTYKINFEDSSPAPNIVIDLLTENYQPVFNYFGSAKSIPSHDTLLIGNYNLKIKYYDFSWNLICDTGGVIDFNQQGEQTIQYRQNNRFSLTGYLNQSNIKLQWATTNSKTKKQFILEKSTNGQQFSRIQEVAASSQATYSALDVHPTNGANFYRVITQFEDGRLEYSETIPVNWQPTGKLHLFPNPATDYVYLTLDDYMDTEIDVVITNQLGKLVYRKHINRVMNADLQINTVDFQDGLHIVSVINKGKAISEKFMQVQLK